LGQSSCDGAIRFGEHIGDLGMTFGVGIKAPLDASVFTASAASFLLACLKAFPLSLHSLTAK
jgi:hypothetical protein